MGEGAEVGGEVGVNVGAVAEAVEADTKWKLYTVAHPLFWKSWDINKVALVYL